MICPQNKATILTNERLIDADGERVSVIAKCFCFTYPPPGIVNVVIATVIVIAIKMAAKISKFVKAI